MKRNELFQTVSSVSMGRSMFDKSHSTIRSFNEGDLIPILCEEVIPGDTWQLNSNALIRSLTPLYPVMDNAKVDTYFFYCRNRNAWDHWKEFCGENNEGSWAPETTYTVPGLTLQELSMDIDSTTGEAFCPYSLFSYLGGAPLTKPDGNGGFDWFNGMNFDESNNDTFVQVLPFRHYRDIWNNFFRSQATQAPLLINKGDTAQTWEYTSANSDADAVDTNGFQKAGRIADYFSSALPAPQRGPAVSLPLVGGEVPVQTSASDALKSYDNARQPMRLVFKDSTFNTGSRQLGVGGGSAAANQMVKGNASSITGDSTNGVQPSNLVIDLEAVDAVSINALRLAFACQRWFEKMGRSGGRYFEYLRSSWSVITSDAVMQMPEYLGGTTFRLDNRQVLQTSSDANSSPLGQTGAYSLSAGSTGGFSKSCDEHGFIIGLAVLRVERSYSQGIPAFLQRKSFFDYYTPELAHIGEQQVRKNELFAGASKDEIFGYKEAWTEYRFSPNTIKGMMDPALKNGYQAWSYGDSYDQAPTLSDDWIKEHETNVDQTIKFPVINESGEKNITVQQFYGSFFFDVRVTRVMPVRSTPGLIDHF